MPSQRLEIQHPCARCGIRTRAEFCLDCKQVDLEMTAGAETATARRARVLAHNRAVRTFWDEVAALGGASWAVDRDRERKRRARRAAAQRERESSAA